MTTTTTPPVAHPSGDLRFQQLDIEVERREARHSALIELLHKAQQLFGHLHPDVLYYLAHKLRLPPSKVYGVATFYHMFALQPKGRHECMVCLGTACYINGGAALLAEVESITAIHAGNANANECVSLTVARCVGACGLAPLTICDGQFVAKGTTESIRARLNEWLGDAT